MTIAQGDLPASNADADADAANSDTPSLPDDDRENSAVSLVRMKGATAFDEVRCELRPDSGLQKLRRPALRSSGQLTVLHVTKYVQMQLGLDATTPITLTCAGQDLTSSMTLNVIVRNICPESDEHLVLHYKVGKAVANP